VSPALVFHVVAGGLGLVTGFVALGARKGGTLHRRSGMLFFYSMVGLGTSGAGIAALQGGEASVIGGLLTGYLVLTALSTVRAPFAGSGWLDRGAMLAAAAIGLGSVGLALASLSAGETQRDGIPVPMFFVHGAIALTGSGGDLRMIRAGSIHGRRRLARHLWRMCFALWIASASFFLAPRRLPEPLRIPALQVFLAFLPLLAMCWWLWRIRRGRPAASPAARPGGLRGADSHPQQLLEQGVDR
jgi:hypothetical protein